MLAVPGAIRLTDSLLACYFRIINYRFNMYHMNAGKRIIIVSNRLPIKIAEQDNEMVYTNSEGGLATGLGSVYQQGNNLWIGWPGGVIKENKKKQIIDDLSKKKPGSCISYKR